MRTSIFLLIYLSLALSLAFTSQTTAAPIQALDLEQIQQQHGHDNTADVNTNEGVAVAAAAPPKTVILLPCPKNWNPRLGHGPICSKTAETAREVEKEKKPQSLDFGLGP